MIAVAKDDQGTRAQCRRRRLEREDDLRSARICTVTWASQQKHGGCRRAGKGQQRPEIRICRDENSAFPGSGGKNDVVGLSAQAGLGRMSRIDSTLAE